VVVGAGPIVGMIDGVTVTVHAVHICRRGCRRLLDLCSGRDCSRVGHVWHRLALDSGRLPRAGLQLRCEVMLVGAIGRLASCRKVRVCIKKHRAGRTRVGSFETSWAGAPGAQAVVMAAVCFATIEVCTGIGGLILEHLHQAIEDDCEDCAEKRPNPIDPMVAGPNASDDRRSEGSGRVQ
jgi:hypothetical protein